MTAPVAVVVVTHDTREDVLACLATIEDVDELVVVDCGSSDGTAAAVRAADGRVRVLELANAGFGRGANAGVRQVRAPVVVVCNADVRFEAGSIDRLCAQFDDPAVGAAGPRVRYPSGAPQASARRIPDVSTILGHGLLGRVLPGNRWTATYHAIDQGDGPRDAEWLSGCALALRRESFVEVGGFDPGYFLYVEDVDLGLRLREAGWRLRFVPDAEVTHAVAASTSRRGLRSLLEHARSLDRFHRLRHDSPAGRLARPLIRVGLGGWVLLSVAVRVVRPASRSQTGERVDADAGHLR